MGNAERRVAGVPTGDEVLNLAGSRDADEARPTAQCRRAAQDGRPAHAARTGHNQHSAEGSFVRICGSRSQLRNRRNDSRHRKLVFMDVGQVRESVKFG